MLLLLLLCPAILAGRLEVMNSWKSVDFTFPSEAVRATYLAKGDFIPKNNIILDVDIWEGNNGKGKKVFVTMPKMKTGTPVTLATVTNIQRNNITLLQPYPDWSWHKGDCNGIISVFRTRVDKCGRLWVIDSGVANVVSNNNKRACSPQVLVFDLKTDKLIKRYRIPSNQLENNSLFITIAVDVRTPDCSDAFAYLADVGAYKLGVYDFKNDKSWMVSSSSFHPNPQNEDFTIAGKHFKLTDGLFGLALGPLRNGDRTLYYHSMASVQESSVSTSVIRNPSLFAKNPAASPQSFKVFADTRSSQSAAEDITDNGILVYSLVGDNAIGCWNTNLPFKKQNFDVIAKDDVTLQFQSGMKVYGNNVYSLSGRFQNFILDEIPENEDNYRINVGKISDLIQHTKCDSSGSSAGHSTTSKKP